MRAAAHGAGEGEAIKVVLDRCFPVRQERKGLSTRGKGKKQGV